MESREKTQNYFENTEATAAAALAGKETGEPQSLSDHIGPQWSLLQDNSLSPNDTSPSTPLKFLFFTNMSTSSPGMNSNPPDNSSSADNTCCSEES